MKKIDQPHPSGSPALEQIPGLEWHLIDVCNYRCDYCSEKRDDPQRPERGRMSDEVIEKVLAVTGDLPHSWLVKFSSGEPTLHRRFIEISRRLVQQGHQVCVTTNFYMSEARQQELVEACADKLRFLTASLHLSQVEFSRFLERAVHFQSIKSPATDFTVSTVMIEENFDELRRIYDEITNRGIAFKFQVLKIDGKFVTYSDEIEQYLADKIITKTTDIRNRNFWGTLCHTGELFFIITREGDCRRCFNQPPLWNDLGSIKDGTFQRFEGPKPCLARCCTCTVPVNRGMIEFGSTTSLKDQIAHGLHASGINLRARLTNAFARSRGKGVLD